jgi:hypothetical protein
MFVQTKEFSTVTPQAFKNAIPVQESVIENTNFRVFFIEKLAINPNF